MLKLKRDVIIVGPDRCWKTSLVKNLTDFYENASYKGHRGDDANIAALMRDRARARLFFDRGLICDRVYNKLMEREVPQEIAGVKAEAEAATMMAQPLYIHLTRRDFSNVKDDLYPELDLGKAALIYHEMVPFVSGNDHRIIYVDNVQTNNFSDPQWVITVGKALKFIHENS